MSDWVWKHLWSSNLEQTLSQGTLDVRRLLALFPGLPHLRFWSLKTGNRRQGRPRNQLFCNKRLVLYAWRLASYPDSFVHGIVPRLLRVELYPDFFACGIVPRLFCARNRTQTLLRAESYPDSFACGIVPRLFCVRNCTQTLLRAEPYPDSFAWGTVPWLFCVRNRKWAWIQS